MFSNTVPWDTPTVHILDLPHMTHQFLVLESLVMSWCVWLRRVKKCILLVCLQEKVWEVLLECINMYPLGVNKLARFTFFSENIVSLFLCLSNDNRTNMIIPLKGVLVSQCLCYVTYYKCTNIPHLLWRHLNMEQAKVEVKETARMKMSIGAYGCHL